MNTGRTEKIKIIAAVYCDVVLFFSFMVLRDTFAGVGGHSGRALAVWLIAAFLIYAANSIFMRRDRELGGIILLNIIAGIPEAAAIILMMGPVVSVWQGMFLAVGIIFVHARIINRFFDPVTVDACIRFFEMSVCLMTGYVFYKSVSDINASTGPFLLSSVVASAAALLASRLENAENLDSSQGRAGLLIVFSVIAAAAEGCICFGIYASDAAGSVLRNAAEGLMDIGSSIVRFVGAIITALLTLMPEGNYQEIRQVPGEGIPAVASEFEEYAFPYERAVGLAALFICAAAAIYIFLRIRHLRPVRLKRSTAAVQSPGSRQSLKDILISFRDAAVRGVRRYIRSCGVRNHPAGIAMTAEKYLKHTEHAKKSCETYPAFMKRTAALLSASAVQCTEGTADANDVRVLKSGDDGYEILLKAAELLGLAADAFDRQYFDGAEPAVSAAEDVRTIKKAVRLIGRTAQTITGDRSNSLGDKAAE